MTPASNMIPVQPALFQGIAYTMGMYILCEPYRSHHEASMNLVDVIRTVHKPCGTSLGTSGSLGGPGGVGGYMSPGPEKATASGSLF